jgi:two-component system nitrogen regulation response regulator GlnG
MMRPSEPAPDRARRPPVLVCDDDPLVRESIMEALAGEFEVEATGRAADVLPRIMRTRYDALVLDLRLPGLGGIEALAVVRQLDPELPVIVITGFASYDVERAARAAGVFYYLPKPFAILELIEAVRAAARARQRKREPG